MATKTAPAAKPEEITVRLDGTTPLLLHNVQLADPLNEYAMLLKELTSKQKSMAPDEFAAQKARLQFTGGLYWDDTIGVHMPGRNVVRSFMEGGSTMRLGTKLGDAMIDYDFKSPIEPWSGKFDTAQEIFDAGHRHMTMIKINGSTVPSTRPRFDEWTITFTATIDSAILSLDQYVHCAELAGRLKGLGDGRKKGYGMGRYVITRI